MQIFRFDSVARLLDGVGGALGPPQVVEEPRDGFGHGHLFHFSRIPVISLS